MPGSIAQERWLYGKTMCFLNPLFARYFYINTVLHLMAVSYDRYDSIVKSPLTYNGTVTKCRVAVIVLIWLIPVGFSIGPFLKWGEYVYNPEVFFCQQQGLTSQSGPSGWKVAFCLVLLAVPVLVIALLNWSVYKTAKRQANAVAIQIGSFDGCESHQQEREDETKTYGKKSSFGCRHYHRRVCVVLSPYLDHDHLSPVSSEEVLVRYCIFTFSSVCNPIIYSIRKRDFRRTAKNLFLRRRITPQTNPSDMENRVTGVIH